MSPNDLGKIHKKGDEVKISKNSNSYRIMFTFTDLVFSQINVVLQIKPLWPFYCWCREFRNPVFRASQYGLYFFFEFMFQLFQNWAVLFPIYQSKGGGAKILLFIYPIFKKLLSTTTTNHHDQTKLVIYIVVSWFNSFRLKTLKQTWNISDKRSYFEQQRYSPFLMSSQEDFFFLAKISSSILAFS